MQILRGKINTRSETALMLTCSAFATRFHLFLEGVGVQQIRNGAFLGKYLGPRDGDSPEAAAAIVLGRIL